MTDIPPINGTGKVSFPSGMKAPARPAEPPSSEMTPDRVEISDVAQALGSLEPNTSVRAEKVAEIRMAMENGTYLTDEKIAITADRLLQVLQASAV